MSDEEKPVELAEYTDGKGGTWQLSEEDAKRVGFERVDNKAVSPKAAAKKTAASEEK